jgi:hypothetical protein
MIKRTAVAVSWDQEECPVIPSYSDYCAGGLQPATPLGTGCQDCNLTLPHEKVFTIETYPSSLDSVIET